MALPVPPVITKVVIDIAESPEYKDTLVPAFKQATQEKDTYYKDIAAKYKNAPNAKTLAEEFPGKTLSAEQKEAYLKSLGTVPGLQGKTVKMAPEEVDKIRQLKDFADDSERAINKFTRNSFTAALHKNNPDLIPVATTLGGKLLRDLQDGKTTIPKLKQEMSDLEKYGPLGKPPETPKPKDSPAKTQPTASISDVPEGHQPTAPLSRYGQAAKQASEIAKA